MLAQVSGYASWGVILTRYRLMRCCGSRSSSFRINLSFSFLILFFFSSSIFRFFASPVFALRAWIAIAFGARISMLDRTFRSFSTCCCCCFFSKRSRMSREDGCQHCRFIPVTMLLRELVNSALHESVQLSSLCFSQAALTPCVKNHPPVAAVLLQQQNNK